ncbi:MAG: septum site-determining protein MinC [Lachnospiraceae bacterium]|nr:septum site-determining protein MinC [Lachnospiraceae bacterium]
MESTVTIKASTNGITVILDDSKSFDEIKSALAAKFKASASLLGDSKMAIAFDGMVLTDKQRTELLNVISENCNLEVTAYYESMHEMDRAAEVKVTRDLMKDPYLARFYKGNLRSGQSLDTENSIIILGDINPGASVISNGNIIVLGAIKGTAFAGALGNKNAFIFALEMNPMQVRIADTIARAPDKPDKSKTALQPRIAFLENDTIYIEPAGKNIINEIKLTETEEE